MKRTFFKALIVLVGLTSLTLTSCKKGTSAADSSISAQDANNVSNAMSSTSDDATAAAGQVSSYKSLGIGGFNNGLGYLLVGASITDTSSTGIVITYDGITPCNGIIRSGTITITNTGGIPWHEAGAVITIQYTNVQVTEVLSGYTYTLNGTHTVTNVSGGLAWQVVAGIATNTKVTHRIQSSNMQITLPGGGTRTWTVDRSRSWSNTSGTLTVSVFSATGANTETGINRFGESFSNSITSPITGNINCLFRPYTGEFQHVIGNATTTVTFGTNSTGQPADNNSPTYCGSYGNYGYYITYMNGGITRTRFVSYWR